MFEVNIQNTFSSIQNLFPYNPDYSIVDIQGLGPSSATISTSKNGIKDGTKYTSSTINERNIVFFIMLKNNIEKSRINLYKIFARKTFIRIFFKNGIRDVFIDGCVENIEVSLFTEQEIMQISVVCPNPFFYSKNEIVDEMVTLINDFHFPFYSLPQSLCFSHLDPLVESVVKNRGEVQTGLTIIVKAQGTVYNPKIFNKNGTFFGINSILQRGDVLKITTETDNKRVMLIRNAQEYNILDDIMDNITWLQLEIGDNLFTYEAEQNSAQYMTVEFHHFNKYEGV